MLSLRPMTGEDLPVVAAWLRLPHVARWWMADTTAEAQIDRCRQRIDGSSASPTIMLTASWDNDAIGWCQWYRWADYPAEAEALGACADEVGIDYAIGDPARIGHGIGARLVGALVAEALLRQPGAGVLTAPDAANNASRRVLEKNGFSLVAIRPAATEPSTAPMAIYRLTA